MCWLASTSAFVGLSATRCRERVRVFCGGWGGGGVVCEERASVKDTTGRPAGHPRLQSISTQRERERETVTVQPAQRTFLRRRLESRRWNSSTLRFWCSMRRALISPTGTYGDVYTYDGRSARIRKQASKQGTEGRTRTHAPASATMEMPTRAKKMVKSRASWV